MEKPFDYQTLLGVALLALVGLYGYVSIDTAPEAPESGEVKVVESQPAATVTLPNEPKGLPPFVEVTEGCNPYFAGPCVNMRSGPGEEHPIVLRLRSGMVLAVADRVEEGGRTWYKVAINEWLRYPERVLGEWYVAADFVEPVYNGNGEELADGDAVSTAKRIIVDRSEQKLYAYDGEALFMEEAISTGLEFTPTPRGTFPIYKKTPSRYMQGPILGISDKIYDLPGVPWNLYFTREGAVIHGAYWHDHFGEPWSSGCVNLPPEKAKALYEWAELGTPVIVRD